MSTALFPQTPQLFHGQFAAGASSAPLTGALSVAHYIKRLDYYADGAAVLTVTLSYGGVDTSWKYHSISAQGYGTIPIDAWLPAGAAIACTATTNDVHVQALAGY